jgi:glucose/arabinose dehydrogenase
MKYLYLNIILFIAFGWFILGLFHWSESVYCKDKDPLSYQKQDGDGVKTIATNLNVPLEIAWGPDNQIWIAEHGGVISKMDPQTGNKQVLLKLTDIWQSRTAGLLGMALHSDMKKFPYVFLCYTIQKDKKYLIRLVRYTSDKDSLINPKILMEIPAANGHNGSRIAVQEGLLVLGYRRRP